MELFATRIAYIWLICVFIALAVKFYELRKISNMHRGFTLKLFLMFLFSSLGFCLALLNTYVNIPHYPLIIGVIICIAVCPFWAGVQ